MEQVYIVDCAQYDPRLIETGIRSAAKAHGITLPQDQQVLIHPDCPWAHPRFAPHAFTHPGVIEGTAAALAGNALTIAANALREVAESLRAYDFTDLYAGYGPGGMFPNTFYIDQLQAGSDGPVGSITFLVDETEDTVESRKFGLPRDLNGDSVANNLNVGVTGNYSLLPVKVSAVWIGAGGRTDMDLYVLLADK